MKLILLSLFCFLISVNEKDKFVSKAYSNKITLNQLKNNYKNFLFVSSSNIPSKEEVLRKLRIIALRVKVFREMKLAEYELYILIDEHIRPLPKKDYGMFNTDSKEFRHNDVDALRHAYVSGVFTMEYDENVSNILGYLNEWFMPNSHTGNFRQLRKIRNMDLWNNSIGRKYGKKSKTREELFWKLVKALKNGELITSLNDLRKHIELPYSF